MLGTLFRLTPLGRLHSMAGIILNVLRVCNIITLLALGAAQWVMIIKTPLTTAFFFFQAVSHFASSVIAVFLILSELNILSSYIDRAWPVFGPRHSFMWLGLAMIVMGAQTLGYLNNDQDYIDHLTLPLWRLTLAAGILALIFGNLNIFLSPFFRIKTGAEELTARMLRGGRAQPQGQYNDKHMYEAEYASSYRSVSPQRKNKFAAIFGGGKKSSKKNNISHPVRSGSGRSARSARTHQEYETDLERGHSVSYPSEPSMAAGEGRESVVSRDSRLSPVMPTIARPPTAQHPMYARSMSPSSRYSTAHLSRF